MQGSCQVQKKNVSSVGNLIEKKILNIEKEKEKAIYHSLNSFRFSSIFLIFKDWINELNHLLELRKP